MKIRMTWQFWAVLAVGYLLGGWRTVLSFLVFMVIVLLLNLIPGFLLFQGRSKVVEAGLVSKDNWLIRLLCSCGLHTRGSVQVEEPKSFSAKDWLRVGHRRLEKRVGKSQCVCCEKELIVKSYKAFDNNGIPGWDEMEAEDYLEYQKAQDENLCL